MDPHNRCPGSPGSGVIRKSPQAQLSATRPHRVLPPVDWSVTYLFVPTCVCPSVGPPIHLPITHTFIQSPTNLPEAGDLECACFTMGGAGIRHWVPESLPSLPLAGPCC